MQKNLNSTIDPLLLRQKNQFLQKKKKVQKLDTALTIEEGEKLLNLWRENNFSDFNSWVQVAKAQVTYDIVENSNEINKSAKKTFTCNLTLTFDEDASLVMISNGFARSKKDAKKMAIEKMVIELIQNGEISRGLRDKNFLNVPSHGGPKPDAHPQPQKIINEFNDENLQKKIHKLSKKMQEFLKKDSFLEACEELCQIVMRKKPEWNEIAFMWSYALLKKEFSYIKAIIDIIQYKRVQPSLNSNLLEELKVNEEINKGTKDEREERIRREFIKKYGFYRLKSDNPYDILDISSVEANLPEIENIREISDEEARVELAKDILSRDLSRAFVVDHNEGFSLGDLRLPSVNGESMLYSDPKLLNVYTAAEVNRLLHKIGFQKFEMPDSSLTTPSNIGGSASANSHATFSAQKNSFVQSPAFIQLQPSSEYKYFSQAFGREDYLQNTIPQIDENTSREIKNPNINYISYKLLNEFYESLLFVGDANFALSVAELLYTKLKLDDTEFFNNFACSYYSNKKNILMNEMIESLFYSSMKKNARPFGSSCSVEGAIEKIGNKYSQEVLLFTPNEDLNQLERKISKRAFGETRESQSQITEGDFVKLSLVSHSSLLPNQFNSFSVENSLNVAVQLNQSIFAQNSLVNPDINVIVRHEIIGCVREIQKDFKIKLFVLPTKEQSEILTQKDKIWKIVKLTNRTWSDRICEALETFCTQISMSHSLLQIFLSPPITNNRDVQTLAETRANIQTKQHKPTVTNLNNYQQKGLDCAATQLLTLIQGPPGTGKTITAVEIVLEWLRLSSAPILVCADSNVAVDRLANEFKEAGVKVVRVGPGYDEKIDLRSEKNYQMYQAFLSAKQYHHANSIRFGIIKKKIHEAGVVCTTCVGSTSEYLKNLTFPRVIIHEAARASEISCLVPLIKGCQQLVLIGDHKQLSPSVLSMFAQSKGMGVSLFERLVRQGIQPNILKIQYTIHPSILQFPSHKFYNDVLQNDVETLNKTLVSGFNWPSPTIGVAFVDVKGVEQAYSSSIQNPREVKVVVEILVQLLNSNNHISSIGIITPYDGQKMRIRNEINMQAKKYPQLFGLEAEDGQKINQYTILNDIETIDESKGVRKSLIIFSAVRSNKTGSLGPLRDPKKLNVILTSATRGVIVIGDMETLVNDSNWREWMQWAKKNRVVLQYQ